MDKALAQAKLLARLHDPAEKALVLLRDPAGHEGGTSRTLQRELFGDSLPAETKRWVKKGDWWASAADRPQFPKGKRDGRYPRWSQVRFSEEPVIRHPLTGDQLDLRASGGLGETDINEIKAQSVLHFRSLIHTGEDGHYDWQRTLLAFWRFGPELRVSEDRVRLGELWRRLPADTRIPDHTIWDHLDLVSAFTGAFQADSREQCALLHVALGPVQEFIAAASTTSDLWAGSHLLARLSWEAMRVVSERLGPDAILFPSLRGVPQADLWLLEKGIDASLFEHEDWKQRIATDSNPLFSAALPNRFLAVVPAETADEIAEAVRTHVREWIAGLGRDVVAELLTCAGLEDACGSHAYQQMAEQLAGFPEVYWSKVGYDELAADPSGGDAAVNTAGLRAAMEAFQPAGDGNPGFLGSKAWEVLQRPVEITDPEDGEAAIFYRPNPGVLYPAVFELGERALAAAKAVRPFSPLTQRGYRCSLTGEVEWLTHDAGHLDLPPGQRAAADTLWTRVAQNRPGWAPKGEHLGGLAAIKRLWPTLFCREIRDVLGADRTPQRFVVSTHTMATSASLRTLLQGPEIDVTTVPPALREEVESEPRAAVPYQIARKLAKRRDGELLARLPSWMERKSEQGERDPAIRTVKRLLGGKDPETYYALLLMDGDAMGKWLSGDPELAIAYKEVFHPKLASGLQQRFSSNAALQDYLETPRAVSPGRHIAISSALNDFSGIIARWIVEERHAGRVLYAGGDDLMAMLPTTDLLSAMRALRLAYSGDTTIGGDEETHWLGSGFVRRRGRIHLCMGARATASIGAVIVHHQAPLLAALDELRAAEQRAKHEGGRNAFSLSVLKRSGGALRHTARWSSTEDGVDEMTMLSELARALRERPEASRRAAYNVQNWLTDLPEPDALEGAGGIAAYLETVLHYQFQRQKLESKGQPIHSRRLAHIATRDPVSLKPLPTAREIRERITNLTGIAEFFARETRS